MVASGTDDWCVGKLADHRRHPSLYHPEVFSWSHDLGAGVALRLVLGAVLSRATQGFGLAWMKPQGGPPQTGTLRWQFHWPGYS
jgi:hypothetical protein